MEPTSVTNDRERDGEIFAARTNSNIDVQSIARFALGVFWKSSFHAWDFGRISLGPYETAIRTWLRGEAVFP